MNFPTLNFKSIVDAIKAKGDGGSAFVTDTAGGIGLNTVNVDAADAFLTATGGGAGAVAPSPTRSEARQP